jgi:RHS repeat-associated protein
MPCKTSKYPFFSLKMRHFGYKSPRNRLKNPPAVAIHRGNFCPKKFVSKERDTETGLLYYGARYLDGRTGRWLSGDPAVGEYVPSAPVDDEARKRNGNLPGQGGVFNYVNLHVYHYAGNNPVKYVDPDGKDVVFAGSAVRRRVESLYKNSATFKSSFDKLLNSRNSLDQRLVVSFTEGEGNYPGFTRTDTGLADKTLQTWTLDEDGNIQEGNIEIGEEVQAIHINIDTQKIRDRNLNFNEVIIEEVMHAFDAASMGSEAHNEAVIREQQNFKYGNGPLESGAKERAQRVLEETSK